MKTKLEAIKEAKACKHTFLSPKYLGASTAHKYRCDVCGIQHLYLIGNLRKRGCRECNGKHKITTADCHALAQKNGRNGKFLSPIYKPGEKLLWECSLGHTWLATFTNINGNRSKIGTWCPDCKPHRKFGQRICKVLFEGLFGVEFKEQRPRWLKSEFGGQLELDGFNEKLGIAFEYQGSQHFDENHYLHKHQNESYKKMKKRDQNKRDICRKKNILLFETQELGTEGLSVDKLKMNIIKFMSVRGIKIPYPQYEIDYSRAYSPREVKIYDELVKIAKAMGYELMTKHYTGVNEFIYLKCSIHGKFKKRCHEFKNNRTGCGKCGDNRAAEIRRKPFNDVKRDAFAKGIEIIGGAYKNAQSPLKAICLNCGHRWPTNHNRIQAGKKCPKCQNRALGENQKATYQVFEKGKLIKSIRGAVETAKFVGISVGSLHKNIRKSYLAKGKYKLKKMKAN